MASSIGLAVRLQVAKHVLQLVEQAARRLVARELRGGCARGGRGGGGQREHGVAEGRNHVELLQERVEVARRAEVLEADVADARLLLRRRHEVPLRARRAAALLLVLEHQPGQRGEVVAVALGQLEQQTWSGSGLGLGLG